MRTILNLKSYPHDKKIRVIKAIRTYTACGLVEAKNALERSERSLRLDVHPFDAEGLVSSLRELGCVVEVRGNVPTAVLRDRVVRAALSYQSSVMWFEENSDDPHGDAQIELNEEILNDAIKAYSEAQQGEQ